MDLKLSLSSSWKLTSLTEDGVSIVFLSNLIVSFNSHVSVSHVPWNFSKLVIILLFLNQLIIISNSDCKVFFNSAIAFPEADKVLSSAKLYLDAIETKKKKWFLEKLNRIDPVMKPWWTPEIMFENDFFYHLYKYTDFGFWDTNKYGITLFHLDRKLKAQILISRAECTWRILTSLAKLHL